MKKAARHRVCTAPGYVVQTIFHFHQRPSLTEWGFWGLTSSLWTPAPLPSADSPVGFQRGSCMPAPAPPCPVTQGLLAVSKTESKDADQGTWRHKCGILLQLMNTWITAASTWYCGIRARWLFWLLSNVKTSKTPTQFTRNLQQSDRYQVALGVNVKKGSPV